MRWELGLATVAACLLGTATGQACIAEQVALECVSPSLCGNSCTQTGVDTATKARLEIPPNFDDFADEAIEGYVIGEDPSVGAKN